MRSFAKTCLVLAAFAVTGMLWHSVTECAADNRFSSLLRLAQGQIERTKAARERAAERLEFSKEGGSFEQLQRSEEDLIRRVENLERVQEQIQDHIKESDAVGRSLPAIAIQELCVSLSEIELQLSATRALAKQLEAARQEAESKATGGSATRGSTSSDDPWKKPCGCGDKADAQCLSNCAKDSSGSSDTGTDEAPKKVGG